MQSYYNTSGLIVIGKPVSLSNIIPKGKTNYNDLKEKLLYSTLDDGIVRSIFSSIGCEYIIPKESDNVELFVIERLNLPSINKYENCAFTKNMLMLSLTNTFLEDAKLSILSYKNNIINAASKVWAQVASVFQMIKNVSNGMANLSESLIEDLANFLESIQSVLKNTVKELGASRYSITISMPPSITLEFDVEKNV